MLERNVQNDIRLALSPLATIFRVNAGKGWTGNNVYHLADNSIVIKNPRPFASGLPAGVSDLIGFKRVVITADMVGATIAQFCAVEVKSAKNKTTKEQENFIDVVKKAGGRAGVARTVDEAIKIIND